MSAEPEDLLGKADALMARHRPARGDADAYAEIPVLDEVVEFPPVGDEPRLPDALAGRDPVMSEPAQERPGEALAASIRAALLAGLQPEIDVLIEQRLKESLAPLVEKLFEDMRGDLQLIARDTLSEAISTAVERELERRNCES